MKVVVTGASGYIGSILVPYLRAHACEVVSLSRRNKKQNGIDCIATDYVNNAQLQDLLEGVDAVVHLAGLAHQSEVGKSLDDYVQANAKTAAAFASAAGKTGVKRFIFVSSIGVYGDNTNGRAPFSERDIPQPVSLYGQSKLIAENLVIENLSQTMTEYVILRPTLIYGAGCSGNFRSLLRLTSLLPVLPFGSMKNKKTMMFIDNFIDAIFQSLHSPEVINQTFIVSDRETLTLKTVIDILLKQFHCSRLRNIAFPKTLLNLLAALIRRQSQWKKFSSNLEVDANKFFNACQWTPAVSAEEGLKISARGYISKL